MKNKINENKVDDPLLLFFQNLLDDEEEKKVLSMIFKGYDENDILEKLINFSTNRESDDKV